MSSVSKQQSIFAMLMLAFSCSSSLAADAIKLGASISVTTDFALAGIQQKGGIDLAIEEINSAGGVPGKGGKSKG